MQCDDTHRSINDRAPDGGHWHGVCDWLYVVRSWSDEHRHSVVNGTTHVGGDAHLEGDEHDGYECEQFHTSGLG